MPFRVLRFFMLGLVASAAISAAPALAPVPATLPIRVSDYPHPLRLACVGDSITYGHLLPDREKNSFPSQLQVLLGGNWVVGSFGRSGATLLRHSPRPYHEQPEYRAALEFKADVVLIQLGTNDTKRETWEAEGAHFVDDYLELIRTFQKNGAKLVVVCHPIPLFRDRGKKWDTDRLLREKILPCIDEVARRAQLPVIDLNATFANQSNLMPDGVHPDVRGATLMAQTLFTALTGRAAAPTSSNPPSATR